RRAGDRWQSGWIPYGERSRFERHHLHRPAVVRRPGRYIGARVARLRVFNQITVELRAHSEARTRRAVPVPNAETIDQITSHRRRGVTARDWTGVTRGPRLGIDGIRPIHARVFGKVNFYPLGVRGQLDRHLIRTAFNVFGIVDDA